LVLVIPAPEKRQWLLVVVNLTLWLFDKQEIGFRCDAQQGECLSRFACHLDCFAWVKRDSYLPQGSQGLKVCSLSFSIPLLHGIHKIFRIVCLYVPQGSFLLFLHGWLGCQFNKVIVLISVILAMCMTGSY
jgi:hypothetical protein